MKNKKGCVCGKALMFIGGVALTIAGFIVIPPIIDKYANKVCKASLKKEKIDFDNMGPEIVLKKKKEEK